MSKLKDYADKIKGWPEKKETGNCWEAEKEGFNQALAIFSNLEFNPAQLVELDEDKIKEIIDNQMDIYSFPNIFWKQLDKQNLKIAQAIVKAKLEVLK